MSGWVRRHPLAAFFTLAYAISWAAATPLVLASRGVLPEASVAWEVLAPCGPLLAALLVTRLSGGPQALRAFVRRLFDWRMNGRTVLLAIVSPVAILAAGVLGTALVAGEWPHWRPAVTFAPAAWLAGLALAALSGPGEEPGWRGFALPRLLRGRSALAATAWLTLAWVPWHLPMFLYRSDLGPLQFVAFAAALFCGAVWLTSIYSGSGGSIAAAIAWHAVWNVASAAGRALAPSPFALMGALVALGALAIIVGWRLAPPPRWPKQA